jgi:hypothetical protein
MTGLANLPDVRPLLEPVGESSSQVPVSVMVVEEETEEEAGKGAAPSMGGAAPS